MGHNSERMVRRDLLASTCFLLLCGCGAEPPAGEHGPIADQISAKLGEILPTATEAQRETFRLGKEGAERRFSRAEGLGPAFNVTFCASCHERPVTGGSAGLYRNFFLSGVRTAGGAFFPGESAGEAGGVIRMYYYGEEEPARPEVSDDISIFAQRSPVPFFGVGLLAELTNEEILARADPDDEDGDGISGRPNWERGFVGRFGRKAQTASIEGFIRGPLFNHLGITSNPLTDEQRAALPVDSSSRDTTQTEASGLRPAQAAVFDERLEDNDGAPDPELSTQELFELVSFSMLLAAPQLEPDNAEIELGRQLFDESKCEACHTPRLNSHRGPLPVYSDLLIHDMGEALADGIEQGEASGAEFRTQPLWGLTAVGPYLHDGRAETIERAIELHGGEATESQERYLQLSESDRAALVAFLRSLGGREQFSEGLIPPGEEMPAPGALGGPIAGLDATALERFQAGRALFDKEFGFESGVGGPRFNGDSCRACHFEPVVGGAGPRGVNVLRHGILNSEGGFVPPSVGTILHKQTRLKNHGNKPQQVSNIFEHRQTPHLFGLGLIESIPEATILANADPDDTKRPDGITGRPSWTDDGRLGRFGWKAQVPSVAEFVRDAVTAELGMTLDYQEGLTFGKIHDNDDVPDPEMSLEDAGRLQFYLENLAAPPRKTGADPQRVERGAAVFEQVGCAVCHIPALEGEGGPVPLFSDLLLHEILPEGSAGIEEASANMREFRTPPLWGLSDTAPYMHSGAADSLTEAIELHDGEAAGSRDRFGALESSDREALLVFLGTL